ncbi:multiple sugar transport system permease protein [Kribbella rubisoli]|uniref:Multiple sugar transport system permease protein n=1 Tax=Kribbella rubisoli TaxID=3075929 RepID=A0A4Q7X2H3_9ACTN|nr:sugar ABC transporter permease [Kribbella rubisoli]RZU16269.1 multiple sugar transport system permease protein [Kribbella rubisoli]
MALINEVQQAARGRARGRRSRIAYLFLLPWIAGVLLITLVPMVTSLYLSFTDYRLGTSPRFTGLENYRRMFSDPDFLAAAGVTAKYVFISVPLQLTFALAIAVLLNQGVRGLAIYRSVYYLPSLLGGSVAVAVLWRQLFSSTGLVPELAGKLGIQMGSWISEPAHALDTLIILHVWTFGSPMIIFLAGLRQIPEELVEAAKVDGAGAWRRFTSVILPLLSPVVFFNLILQLIGSFQAFTQAYIISAGTGGPANSTLFYTLYLFVTGFKNFEMGYASALAWILFVVIGMLTAINFVAARYWVHYED